MKILAPEDEYFLEIFIREVACAKSYVVQEKSVKTLAEIRKHGFHIFKPVSKAVSFSKDFGTSTFNLDYTT